MCSTTSALAFRRFTDIIGERKDKDDLTVSNLAVVSIVGK
jgi:hypothetical protein